MSMWGDNKEEEKKVEAIAQNETTAKPEAKPKNRKTLEEKIQAWEEQKKQARIKIREYQKKYFEVYGKYAVEVLNEYSEQDTANIKEIKDKIFAKMSETEKEIVNGFIAKSKTGK